MLAVVQNNNNNNTNNNKLFLKIAYEIHARDQKEIVVIDTLIIYTLWHESCSGFDAQSDFGNKKFYHKKAGSVYTFLS